MTINQILGSYKIEGKNQDDSGLSYKGELILTLDKTNRVVAKWLINDSQEQFGTGFFKDNILVINFNYKNEDEFVFKGVVVYKCLSEHLLQGFWSEKYGDPNFLGEETCYKLQVNKNTLN